MTSELSALGVHRISTTDCWLAGTGFAVAPGLLLTAWHVVEPERTRRLRVDDRSVRRVITLPLRAYRHERALAQRSYRRARHLAGYDAGTVDLALLAVPGLASADRPIRHVPIGDGERLIVAGYPGGSPLVTTGLVAGHDDADLVVHVLLGPGASGSPAFDVAGRLVGICVLDHTDVGTIVIGPRLVDAFITCSRQLLEPSP